ncbi:MAG TPA: hypothetical protein DCG32_08660 [Sphaerochaeta sp.]|nr:hypothetical protein [Sphaerochaeta sp.]
MTKKAEYRLAGLALFIVLLSVLGMNSTLQDFIIGIISPLFSGSAGNVFKFGKYFTPERMMEYFAKCMTVLLQLEVICVLVYLVWQKTKNKVHLVQGEFSPFVLLAIGGLLLHVFLILNWGDDLYFRDTMQSENLTLSSFLAIRYNNWSSRLIIEALLVLIAHSPIVWWFLDTAIIVLAAHSLSRLLPKMDRRTNYLLVCLVFTYPFIDMRTAGWIATTMNYIWPLSLGLYAMVAIKKILQGEPLRIYHYVLSVLALLYAANHEQMGTLLVGFFVFFSVYQVVVQKKLHWFLLVQALLGIASVVFILIAPGNGIRTAWTIETQFPGYVALSLFDKLEMGFSSTLFGLVMEPNLSFIVFGLVLFLAAKVTKQSRMFLLIAAVPLFFSLVFGLLGPVFGKLLPFVGFIRGAMTETGTNPTFSDFISLVPDLLLIVICLSVLVSLYRIFVDKKDAWLVLLVLGAGFASRMIMAFTPSIWFSEDRTFIYLYFALIYCSVRLFQVVRANGPIGNEKFVITTATVFAGFSWLFNIMVGCVTHMLPMS